MARAFLGWLSVSAALLAGLAPMAGAGEATAVGRAVSENPVRMDAIISRQTDHHVMAGQILGQTVIAADGAEIGEVTDVILDEDGERLAGVVVGMGGFLGIGRKTVAIDWSQAELRRDPQSGAERVFIGLTRADLQAAPEFQTREQLDRAAETAGMQRDIEQAPAAGSPAE
jgi:sporulation protein YlmC with PRC-barrel domain